MSHRKNYLDRVYQVVGEPGPGSIAVGYVRYSSALQDPASIAAFAKRKKWKIVRWYEEAEQSAKYEEIEHRPVFAQLLNGAGTRFQVAMCSTSGLWSRNVAVAYGSLAHLRQLQIWWPTADGLWDTNGVAQDGIEVFCLIEARRPTQRASRKEVR